VEVSFYGCLSSGSFVQGGVAGGLLEGENLKNFLVFALLVCDYYIILLLLLGTVLISIVLALSHASIAQFRISCCEAVNCSMNV